MAVMLAAGTEAVEVDVATDSVDEILDGVVATLAGDETAEAVSDGDVVVLGLGDEAADPGAQPAGEPGEPAGEPGDGAETGPAPADVAADAPSDAPTADLATVQQENVDLRKELSRRQTLEGDITEQNRTVDRLASEVMSCESTVEEAKGELKAAKEKYDSGVRELRGMVRDLYDGQGRLDLSGEAGSGAAAVTAVVIQAGPNGELNLSPEQTAALGGIIERSLAANANAPAEVDQHAVDPITVLLAKDLRLQVGNDEFQRLKDVGSPIGMTDKEIEHLEGADIKTIGGLEKRMRENAWWFKSFGKGWGESKTAKVIESLRVFRARWPMPAEPEVPAK